MMKMALRIAGLFVAYTAIGFGGEYAVGLVAWDSAELQSTPTVEVADVQVAREVQVARQVLSVRPTVVSRVQVRHAGECTFEEDRQLTVSGTGVTELGIRAGAGELHVEGKEELDDIVVVGALCASHEEYLEELSMTVEEGTDGRVTLVTHHPDEWDRSGRGNIARIHLTVLVPSDVSIDIDDSSGDIEALGTGPLKIDDSSGSIRITAIDGNVQVDDSSGDIEVVGVTGDVEISDGSGSLDVSEVLGSVVLRDGSGGIEVLGVRRDVIVEEDGSGSIRVQTVGGDLIVDRDGSGGITHSGVEGRVEVPEKKRRRGGS